MGEITGYQKENEKTVHLLVFVKDSIPITIEDVFVDVIKRKKTGATESCVTAAHVYMARKSIADATGSDGLNPQLILEIGNTSIHVLKVIFSMSLHAVKNWELGKQLK